MKRTLLTIAVAAVLCTAAKATPQIVITEWMYNGNGTSSAGEFVELTNMGSTAIDFTGWSFDDSSRTAGSESLAGFGIVQAGESVIFTDDTAANFRTNWGLASTVKVIGGNTNNLGRGDEINIYDASNVLVDRLTYDDSGSGTVKGPRTNSTSAWAPVVDLGINNASQWHLSSSGDGSGDYLALAGERGSPGYYQFAPVPEPSTYVLLGVGLVATLFFGRRKRKT